MLATIQSVPDVLACLLCTCVEITSLGSAVKYRVYTVATRSITLNREDVQSVVLTRHKSLYILAGHILLQL